MAATAGTGIGLASLVLAWKAAPRYGIGGVTAVALTVAAYLVAGLAIAGISSVFNRLANNR